MSARRSTGNRNAWALGSTASCRGARWHGSSPCRLPPRERLRGDFEATVDLVEPVRSRATGRLQGTDVGLPGHIRRAARDRPRDARGGRRARAGAGHAASRRGRTADAERQHCAHRRRTGRRRRCRRRRRRRRALARPAARRTRRSRRSTSPLRWPARGRIGVRATHVDVLGYRMEPFAATVAFGDRRLTAEVTDARVCGIAFPFTLAATEEAIGRERPRRRAGPARRRGDGVPHQEHVSAHREPWISTRTSRRMDPRRRCRLPMQGSARLRARDGRIGGAHALSGVLKLDDVNERLPGAEREFRPRRDALRRDRGRRTARGRARAHRPRAAGESGDSTSSRRARSGSSTGRWR